MATGRHREGLEEDMQYAVKLLKKRESTFGLACCFVLDS